VKKVILTTIIAGLLMIQALTTFGQSPEEDAIAERIKPVGEVCIEGQSCLESAVPKATTEPTPEAAPVTAAETVPASETVVADADSDVANNTAANEMIVESYTKTCAICHAAGVAGAPKLGSSEDWAARIAKGKEVLYQSSINGLAPAMPAKGMCFSCSDDDLKALVDYMVENSQ
jgi:cytochrome c5